MSTRKNARREGARRALVKGGGRKVSRGTCDALRDHPAEVVFLLHDDRAAADVSGLVDVAAAADFDPVVVPTAIAAHFGADRAVAAGAEFDALGRGGGGAEGTKAKSESKVFHRSISQGGGRADGTFSPSGELGRRIVDDREGDPVRPAGLARDRANADPLIADAVERHGRRLLAGGGLSEGSRRSLPTI